MMEDIVKKERFTTNAALNARIAYLENLKDEQERLLQENMIEIHKSLQPMELVKNAIDKVRHDVEIREKTEGLVGSMAVSYLANRLVRNRDTPAGFLKALVVEQLATSVYRKNEKKINGFLKRIASRLLEKLHKEENKDVKDDRSDD